MTKAAEAVLVTPCALTLMPARKLPLNSCSLMVQPIPTLKRRGLLRSTARRPAIEAGAVKPEPWEDVKRRIEKEILGR